MRRFLSHSVFAALNHLDEFGKNGGGGGQKATGELDDETF